MLFLLQWFGQPGYKLRDCHRAPQVSPVHSSTSYPVHPPTFSVFDYHDIDWTVFVVIVLQHVIEVINSQTISETNGVMTANT